jgi:hypothetical protein
MIKYLTQEEFNEQHTIGLKDIINLNDIITLDTLKKLNKKKLQWFIYLITNSYLELNHFKKTNFIQIIENNKKIQNFLKKHNRNIKLEELLNS